VNVRGALLALLAAVAVHALVLLFGGVLLFTGEELAEREPVREVELFAEEAATPELETEPEPEPVPQEAVTMPSEQPPDMSELIEPDEAPPAQDAAATDAIARLDALSLSALESALAGGGAGSEFGGAGVSLAAGGRIGGTGLPGAGEATAADRARDVFELQALDEPARPLFQSPPNYPSELRRRKIEGTVFVVFVVDPQGKVENLRVERSSDPGFEQAALDAVRRWRFEPAVRGGAKVPSRMRIPIRFALES